MASACAKRGQHEAPKGCCPMMDRVYRYISQVMMAWHRVQHRLGVSMDRVVYSSVGLYESRLGKHAHEKALHASRLLFQGKVPSGARPMIRVLSPGAPPRPDMSISEGSTRVSASGVG
jgi:hypothetical protein